MTPEALIALFGGSQLVVKMLGPTAAYIGDGIKDYTEKRIDNLKAIIANAQEKLGEQIDQPGQIPPRVLKEIMDEGSFADDPVAIEYFGGILASSRTGVNRDDRSKYYLSIVGRLSSYQIRAHFLTYHCIKEIYSGSDLNPALTPHNKELGVFIPNISVGSGLDIQESEVEGFTALMGHIYTGLKQEGLIGSFYFGNPRDLARDWKFETDQPGVIVHPSALGVTLFLLAYGRTSLTPHNYLEETVQFERKSLTIKGELRPGPKFKGQL